MKVIAAEGHKGVPLDPALADLLQGLLKLDSRHRLSARDALASAYFAPRPGLMEERFDAWVNLRGDLDKVQMGVATPDQLRGTFAAAHAPTGPPPPPPPREIPGVLPQSSPPGDDFSSHPSSQDGHTTRDRAGRRSHSDNARDSRRERAKGAAVTIPSVPREGLHVPAPLPLKLDPAELNPVSGEKNARRSRVDRVRLSSGERANSRSPASGRVSRRRSPATGRKDHRERDRDERERERRGRKRDRERGAARSRERERHGSDRPG
ncbi:unnamed protein product, partial [Hapterophycus canaliculatus]